MSKLVIEAIERNEVLKKLKETPPNRVVPVRKEGSDKFFVALYVRSPFPLPLEVEYPEKIALADGTEVAVVVFDVDKPTARDIRRPTQDDIAKIQMALQNHSETIFKSRNVSIVTGEGKSILIGVHHLGICYFDDEPLPKELDGIPVIVREMGPFHH